MYTYLMAFVRKNYLIALILSVVLFGATAVIADIVSGLSTTGSSANVMITNLSLTKPSDVAQGDLMLASIALHDGNTTSATPPSGWTQVLRTDNDTNIGIISYYKVAGASEPASYTWTLSPQTRAQGGITRYNAVDTSNPIDQAAGNTGRSKIATTSSITTTAANDEIVSVYALHQGSSNFAGDFFSVPTDMTEKFDSSYTTAGPTIASFDAMQTATGATGSKSSTISGNPNQQRDWASQQIALRRSTKPLIMDSLPLTVHDHYPASGDSFNYTVPSGGSDKVLVAIIAVNSCSEITSISQNGQSFASPIHVTGAHDRADYCVAYLPAPQSGQFAMSFNRSDETINYVLMTIQNADQTNPIDATNVVTNSNLTSSQTTSVTTTGGNDLLLSRSFYAGPTVQSNFDVTVSSYGTGESEIHPARTFATTGAAGFGPHTGTQKNAAATPGVESMVTHWSLQGDIDEVVVAIKPVQ